MSATPPSAFGGNSELVGDVPQQWWKWWLIDAQKDAGEAQVAELHNKAQPVRCPSVLPDDRQVGIAERVVPDQVVLGVRQGQQAFTLDGGQDRTAGHAVSFFLKT
jgi:hypothetical protein